MLLKHHLKSLEPKENASYQIVFFNSELGAHKIVEFPEGRLSDLEYIFSVYGDHVFLADYVFDTGLKVLYSFEILG